MDTNYSSVSLLLHGDGVNDSTTFTDNSPTPKTVTAVGNAQIKTAVSKFGGSSIYFDGTGDCLTVPSSADFDFGTGDFTVEAWVYMPVAGASYQCVYSFTNTNSGPSLYIYDGKPNWYAPSSTVTHQTTLGTNTWMHVAVCRQSGVIKLFADGVLALTTPSYASAIPASTVVVGAATATAVEPFPGYIDDIRVTKGIARYTAAFTPPTEAFADSGTVVETGAVSLVSPAPTVSAYTGGVSELAPPAPMFYAGVVGAANAALTAPAPTLASASGANLALTAPSPTLFSLGHNSYGEQAAFLTAPSPLLAITTGANAKLTAPSPTLALTATGTIWGKSAVKSPAPTLSATGTVSGMATASLTAPSPNLIGYGGAVCSITLTNGPTVVATGATGAVGGAAITCPLFTLTAAATVQNFGSANLIAPAARMGAQAQAYIIAPSAALSAIGTAVITATHEAYALNLNHTPRKGNEVVNDEMTRYTNFPFTHVVRYQNSYFGANSTGLYLLEGTTDDGAPIEWEVKTAFTDFDSAQHKTLEMAYFGGRLGPEATISLFAGEQATNPYEYTTPRGAAAQNYRQPFGRGQKARYYALGASGDDVVTIDSITLNVATLARKV